MVEYFERKAFGRHIDASRLFLYKVTRNLLRLTGDTGAYQRSTMGAMRLFGVPQRNIGNTTYLDLTKNLLHFVMLLRATIRRSNTFGLTNSNLTKQALADSKGKSIKRNPFNVWLYCL